MQVKHVRNISTPHARHFSCSGSLLEYRVSIPLQKKFKLGTKIKYIHITSVILAVVVPIILPLLHLIDGYTIGPNPIIESCSGRNASLNYFLLILPVSILLAFTSSLFVIVFWTILKVQSNNIVYKERARFARSLLYPLPRTAE